MRTSQLTRPIIRPAGSYICRACQPSRRRLTSSSTTPEASPPPPPPKGLAALTSRRLISVTGPDAAKFLNGVITNTFTGRPIYTAFLNAQGRILHDVFIYPHLSPEHRDGFVIEVDATTADTLQRHIRRFRLRSKFETRLVPADELAVYQAWDDGKPLDFQAADGEAAAHQLVDPRAPGLGTRFLVGGSTALPGLEGLEKAPESAYTIRRYLHGVAEGPREIIPESALPAETNLDLAGAVDWHKGCYVGQELTIRTRHRGVVRKRILPCMVYGGGDGDGEAPPEKLKYQGSQLDTVLAEEVPVGTNVVRAGEGKAKSAGKWLGGIGNVGLALCRLEMVNKGLSESPEGQFVMRSGVELAEGEPEFEVKVKPFLPAWLVQGIEREKPSS